MKKLLLLGSALALTCTMSAQSLIYFEDFEGSSLSTYTNATTPVPVTGLPGWTFESTTTQGRLRTSAGGGFALSGSRAMTLDAATITSPDPENSLILTYDMSSYTTANAIELRFWSQHHGEEVDFGDRVWIRGSNSAAWIEVVNLNSFFTFSNVAQWLEFVVDVQTVLTNAGQNFSSTFQVRFGQMDNFPAASVTSSDGITFDNVSLLENVYSVNFVGGNFQPCFNDSNGSIVAEASFGAAPYSYAWSTGATTASVDNLAPGTYTVTATDANGDTVSNSIDLIATTPINATQSALSQLVCKYDEAAVQVLGTGGEAFTEPYSMDTNSANYAWDSSGTCTPVSFGANNQVSVLNDIGFDFEFYGNTYDQFQLASNGFIGFGGGLDDGCCDGQILPNNSTFQPNDAIFAIWGGMQSSAASYSYCLAGEAPFRRLIVNFIDIKDCCTGTTPNGSAQIIIHETTNCIEIQTDYWDPTNVSTFDEQTQGIQNDGGTLAQWYPGRNGIFWPAADDLYIQFCPVDSTGLLYTWSDGFMGQINQGLSAGTYGVTISDALGCEVVEPVVLNPAPSNLTLDPIILDISCFGFDDGSIASNQSGGITPIAYSWSSGQTSADISNLDGGSYTVVATDNLGCLDSVVNIMIEEPSLLVSAINSLENPNCPGEPTGAATVVANGGRMPYTYAWSDGQLSAAAVSLEAGLYLVTVTDSSGCQSVQSVNISSVNPSPVVDLGTNYQSTTGVGVTLNAGNYASFLWSTQETTQSIHVGQTGTYWVEAFNSAGCKGTDTVYVEIWPNGINEEDGRSILSLYPNPTKDRLTLNFQGEVNLTNVLVSVTDLQGRTVVRQQISSLSAFAPVEIDVNTLTPGMYNLSVQSDDVQIDRVFVKQ